MKESKLCWLLHFILLTPSQWELIGVVLQWFSAFLQKIFTLQPSLRFCSFQTGKPIFFFSPSFDKLPTLPMSQEDVKIEDRWQKIIVGRTVLFTEGRWSFDLCHAHKRASLSRSYNNLYGWHVWYLFNSGESKLQQKSLNYSWRQPQAGGVRTCSQEEEGGSMGGENHNASTWTNYLRENIEYLSC